MLCNIAQLTKKHQAMHIFAVRVAEEAFLSPVIASVTEVSPQEALELIEEAYGDIGEHNTLLGTGRVVVGTGQYLVLAESAQQIKNWADTGQF